MPEITAREITLVSVDEIQTHPENPRRGDPVAIAESYQELTMYQPIVVQRSTGYVLVGNHRLLAARFASMPEVPVIYLDVDDAKAKRILLADNKHSDNSTWDDQSLLDMLDEFEAPDFAGTGFNEHDRDLLRQLLEGGPDEPVAPPAPSANVKCKIGSVAFEVSRDAWEAWESEMLALTGGRHEEMVAEARQRLAL